MGISESTRRGTVDACIALPDTPSQTPESEYSFRLGKRRKQLAAVRALHRRLWVYLIVAALAGIVILFASFSWHVISTVWVLLPSVGMLSIIHSLINNAGTHSRVQRIVSFYELGVTRLQHQWQGQGIDGREFLPEDHAYASDLDLFGTGSLFELLCTARTGIGRATLAKWLLKPAECKEAIGRQVAVAELRDMLDLREYWASVGREALGQVASSGSVRDWADAPGVAFPSLVQALTIALPICLIGFALFAQIGLCGHNWLLVIAVCIGLEALLAAVFLKKTRLTTANLLVPSFELALLVPLLEHLEKTEFQCPLLRSLHVHLAVSSGCASKQIRILKIYTWLLNLRQIDYFAALASLVLWGTNLAILIERWRARNRQALVTWLDCIGQFEALLSLARYSFENPDHTFAVLKSSNSPLFQAEALGHPLVDRKTCVRSDLRLDAQGIQLIMVSGSNMSGKSTLLRSVGINTVLAFAGAPVRAARLVISPLQIGCSIAVRDSLRHEKSQFQAEVERLKWIRSLSRSNNLLFLLDEILGGTNSKDRFWGARAVIEQLIASGAIGVVTTHDLILTEVVKGLDGRAINVHFEEHYENGEMRFDYRMRPGVLTRTNGLNIMAALGLFSSSHASELDRVDL